MMRTSGQVHLAAGNLQVPTRADAMRPDRSAAMKPVQRRILLQVLVCTAVPSVFMALGQFSTAGQAFWGLLALCILVAMTLGRASEILCVVAALFPLVNQLRGFGVFYSIVPVVLLVVLAYVAYVHRGKLPALIRSNGLLAALLVFCLLYYLASYITMKSYDANIRLLEFGLAVLGVYALMGDRMLAVSVLQGMAISGVAVSLALLPHLDPTVGRLGLVVQDGETFGNPITLGLPLAFTLLAAVADGGKWLGMEKKLALRILVIVAVAGPLVLSASRVSWMIAVVGALVTVFFGGRRRWGVIGTVAAMALIINVLLVSPYGDIVERSIDRTFSDERSATNRTSGRTDQWLVAEYVFTKSAPYMFFGYGPGRGIDVYERYSARVPDITYRVGSRAAWHAFFMQLAVELGLLGFLPFMSGLLVATSRSLAWTRHTGLLFPIMCMLGYVVVIFTVSGSDTMSASLLAIGLFFGRRRPKRKVMTGKQPRGQSPGIVAKPPVPAQEKEQV